MLQMAAKQGMWLHSSGLISHRPAWHDLSRFLWNSLPSSADVNFSVVA